MKKAFFSRIFRATVFTVALKKQNHWKLIGLKFIYVTSKKLLSAMVQMFAPDYF